MGQRAYCWPRRDFYAKRRREAYQQVDMPSLAVRLGLDSGVHRLLETPPAPNAVAPTLLREFCGAQAAAGGLPEAQARITALALQAGTAPTYGGQSPYLGSRDGSVLGNGGGYFLSANTDDGNVSTLDLLPRVLARVVASKVIFAKRTTGVGYVIGFDATPALYLTIQDADGAATVTSGTLVAGSIVFGECPVNRDDATQGGRWLVNGAWSGTLVDCSATEKTLDAAVALAVLADSAGANQFTSDLLFCAIYGAAAWYQAGAAGVADALADHLRQWALLTAARPAFGVGGITYPSDAGSTSPVFQQRRLSDGTDRLFYMGAGSPCFDRIVDAAGRAVVAHLVEVAAISTLTYSSTFTSWAAGRASISTTPVALPDGATGIAHIIKDTAVENTHYIARAGGNTATTAGPFTIFAKAIGGSWLNLTTDGGKAVYFNVAAGSVGFVGAGCTGRITALGGGWYRLELFIAARINSADCYLFLSNDGITTSYTGDATDRIAVWRGQYETGDYPSSPIVTAAAAVTRAASVCKYSAANCFPRAEGTVIGAILCRSFTPTRARVLFSISDGSVDNEVQIFTTATTGLLSASSRKAAGTSGDVVLTASGSVYTNAIIPVMVAWRQGQLNLWARISGVWVRAQDLTIDAVAGATFTTFAAGSDGAGANQCGPGAYWLAGWQSFPQFISNPSAVRSGVDTLWSSY